MVDTFLSMAIEALAITSATFYLILFKVESFKSFLEIELSNGFEHVLACLFTAAVSFMVNCVSFSLVRCERKTIKQESRCDEYYDETTISYSRSKLTNCFVKFFAAWAIIQKLTWILIINLAIFQFMADHIYVLLLKIGELYFLSSFYAIARLQQAIKNVKSFTKF